MHSARKVIMLIMQPTVRSISIMHPQAYYATTINIMHSTKYAHFLSCSLLPLSPHPKVFFCSPFSLLPFSQPFRLFQPLSPSHSFPFSLFLLLSPFSQPFLFSPLLPLSVTSLLACHYLFSFICDSRVIGLSVSSICYLLHSSINRNQSHAGLMYKKVLQTKGRYLKFNRDHLWQVSENT